MSDWSSLPTFGLRAEGVTYHVRPGAYAVVPDGDGRIAIVRTPHGVYLPGGGIDAGESAAQAAVREVREECGLVVRLGAWSVRAVQFAHSVGDHTDYEKHCTFVDALIERRVAPVEADHELLWLTPAEARTTLTHDSERWAVAQWESASASGS